MNGEFKLLVSIVIALVGTGSFTLYEPAKTNETFNLPVYPETSDVPVRVALTALAVAGDTVMVGVVASVAATYFWLARGAPGIKSLNR